MQWEVKYEPQTQATPWNVYKISDTDRVLDKGFQTEEEAKAFADKKELKENPKTKKQLNKVDEASIQSFPASDAPGWTTTTAGPAERKDKN